MISKGGDTVKEVEKDVEKIEFIQTFQDIIKEIQRLRKEQDKGTISNLLYKNKQKQKKNGRARKVKISTL